VALLPRSAELQPLILRFVLLHPPVHQIVQGVYIFSGHHPLDGWVPDERQIVQGVYIF